MFFHNIKGYIEGLRAIHPVGQGAFYTETFMESNYNRCQFVAVYDCGSKTKNGSEIIKETVGHTLLDHRIDVLFISHFHDDHTNGVAILQDMLGIDKIVIPFTPLANLLIDFIYNIIDSPKGPNNEFILNNLQAILKVGDATPDVVVVDDTYDVFYTGQNKLWQYHAFVSRDEGCEMKALNVLNDIGNKFPTFATIISMIKENPIDIDKYNSLSEFILENIDSIRESYKNILGNQGQNIYSLAVFSSVPFIDTDSINSENSCLYLGDMTPGETILNFTKSSRPEMIQVPHHGSDFSHRQNLYHIHQSPFCSYGENNQYNHPGQLMINDVVRTCHNIHMVTENDNSYCHSFYI